MSAFSVSWISIITVAAVTYVLFYLLGNALLPRKIQVSRPYFAPLTGYAVYAYVFFPLFYLTTNAAAVWAVQGALLGVGLWGVWKHKYKLPAVYTVVLLCSAAIAAYVMWVMAIRFSMGDPMLTASAYDHIKSSITASIAYGGLPATNPFCAFPQKMTYYLLHYIPNTVWVISYGISTYEAEIIAAILTTLAGIGAMFGTLCVIRQKPCSWKEIAVCTIFICAWHAGVDFDFLSHVHDFDTILETLLWSPQVFWATACLLLVLCLVYQTQFKHVWLMSLLLAVTAGASIYIAIVAAGGLGLFFMYQLMTRPDKTTLLRGLMIGAVSLLLAAPFLLNQGQIMSSYRLPVEISLFPWTTVKNPLFQIVGFWTIYYVLRLPLISLLNLCCTRKADLPKYAVFYFTVFASLFITCFLQTTISNNDLGWRAILVSIVVLTPFSVKGWASIANKKLRYIIVILAVIWTNFPFTALNKDGDAEANTLRTLSVESVQAIQHYITPEDRFLSNTSSYVYLTNKRGIPAPILNENLDFMIFPQRKSCYAGDEISMAHCAPHVHFYKWVAKYIFAGEVSAIDVAAARELHCNKFIVHRSDPNFKKDDALQAAGLQKLFENAEIKIYQ